MVSARLREEMARREAKAKAKAGEIAKLNSLREQRALVKDMNDSEYNMSLILRCYFSAVTGNNPAATAVFNSLGNLMTQSMPRTMAKAMARRMPGAKGKVGLEQITNSFLASFFDEIVNDPEQGVKFYGEIRRLFTREVTAERDRLAKAGIFEPFWKPDDGVDMIALYGPALSALYKFKSDDFLATLFELPNLGNIRRINLEQVARAPSGAYLKFLQKLAKEAGKGRTIELFPHSPELVRPSAHQEGSRHMTWPEMVAEYPDRWVAIDNAKMKGSNVTEGDVVAVLTDDKLCDFEDKHLADNWLFRRTTEGRPDNGFFSGIIQSDFKMSTVPVD